MKVLFLSNAFPGPHDPLGAPYNFRLIERLAERHDVRVVCPVSWAAPQGPQDFALPVSLVVLYPRFYYVPRLRAALGWFMWWSLKGHLRRFVEAWQPDVILTYWTHPDGEVAVRLASEVGRPVVQMVGGSDVLVAVRDFFRRGRIARVLRSVDAVIAIGQDLGRAAVALGAPAERVVPLVRPVDRRCFQPGSRTDARAALGLPLDRRIALWVGRYVPVKGLPILVKAMDLLTPSIPDLLVYLVADTRGCESLRRLVASCHLEERIRFAGPAPAPRLALWYRAADVTVLPSLSEGIPNVLLESIVCGTPFVASDVGGIREIADPVLDRLVAPGKPEELAAALADMLSRPQSPATRRVLPPSPETFVAQVEDVLTNVVQAHASRRCSAA